MCLIGLLVGSPQHVGAESADLPSIASSSVYIINRANRNITYSIRPKNGSWVEYTIASGDNRTISCNGCNTQWFEIIVVTNDRQVRYDLEAARRFTIGWNGDAQVWDIYRADLEPVRRA